MSSTQFTNIDLSQTKQNAIDLSKHYLVHFKFFASSSSDCPQKNHTRLSFRRIHYYRLDSRLDVVRLQLAP
jgi:hypothetical protein